MERTAFVYVSSQPQSLWLITTAPFDRPIPKKDPMSRALIACLVATLVATPALAQTAPPSAGDSDLGGPAIPGLCLLSQQAVINNTKIGLAASLRLQQLTQQIRAELQSEEQPLQAAGQALEAQRATMKPALFQQKQQLLAERGQALQDTAQRRQRQLDLTRQKALNQIAEDERPLITQAYKSHNCGLLFDRTPVMGGNMTNDLTQSVVQALDARITTITFDLEPLPPESQGQGR